MAMARGIHAGSIVGKRPLNPTPMAMHAKLVRIQLPNVRSFARIVLSSAKSSRDAALPVFSPMNLKCSSGLMVQTGGITLGKE